MGPVEALMNLLEIVPVAGPQTWLGGAALALALLALLVTVVVARRGARERARLEVLQRDLQTFTEASVRVAESLDHVLRGAVTPGAAPAAEASVSSRRYLLMQARERLQQGEPLDSLASSLHLCDDEKHLLRFLQGEGRPRVRVA